MQTLKKVVVRTALLIGITAASMIGGIVATASPMIRTKYLNDAAEFLSRLITG